MTRKQYSDDKCTRNLNALLDFMCTVLEVDDEGLAAAIDVEPEEIPQARGSWRECRATTIIGAYNLCGVSPEFVLFEDAPEDGDADGRQ